MSKPAKPVVFRTIFFGLLLGDHGLTFETLAQLIAKEIKFYPKNGSGAEIVISLFDDDGNVNTEALVTFLEAHELNDFNFVLDLYEDVIIEGHDPEWAVDFDLLLEEIGERRISVGKVDIRDRDGCWTGFGFNFGAGDDYVKEVKLQEMQRLIKLAEKLWIDNRLATSPVLAAYPNCC